MEQDLEGEEGEEEEEEEGDAEVANDTVADSTAAEENQCVLLSWSDGFGHSCSVLSVISQRLSKDVNWQVLPDRTKSDACGHLLLVNGKSIWCHGCSLA